MKEKIIAAIKAKYPAVNLTRKRLDAIATKLEGKVTDESEIDAVLDTFNEYNPLVDIAKQDDAMVFLKNKLKSTGQPSDNQQDNQDSTHQQTAETPTDKLLKELLSKVTKLETEKKEGTISEKLLSHEKVKVLPKSFLKGRAMPDSLDDIDTYAESLHADYEAFLEETGSKKGADVSKNLLDIGVPKGGNNPGGGEGLTELEKIYINSKAKKN